jgi:hypothetical protein
MRKSKLTVNTKRTLLHHPDKVSPGSDRTTAESYYVHLKFCRDILIDPTKRFAYDRLGPDVFFWRPQPTSIPDFLFIGLRNLVLYYSGTAAVSVSWVTSNKLLFGDFWLWQLWVCLKCIVLHLHNSLAC